MNELLSYEILHNSLRDWFIALVIIVVAIFIGQLIKLFANKVLRPLSEKAPTQLFKIIVASLQGPMVLGFTLGGIWGALHHITLPEAFYKGLGTAYRIFVTVNATWFIAQLVSSLLETYLGKVAANSEKKFDQHALMVVQKAALFFIWSIGIVTALNNAGVNVGALLAGLGIGGVAIALAAQDTAKNILGGVFLLIDHPFRIGDLVKIGDTKGTVEAIGIRSTKLRTYDKSLVTIPNYKTSDTNLENLSQQKLRIVIELGVTYDTTPEKMDEALRILRSLPQKVEGLDKETRVFFTDYGDFSLNITAWVYVRRGVSYYDVKSNVNLTILHEFNEAGLNFAFPTQTLYVNKGEREEAK
ncbi:MAG: mechanosensitive ion channel family protein [Paludibacteraceae bacterium]|nr:mechanosensitive ion channel family protein [Paludibacteraceae bacterium]